MIHWSTLLVALLTALLLIAPPVPAALPAGGNSPSAGADASGAVRSPQRQLDARSMRIVAAKKSAGRVNINNADVKELMTLSGVGRTVAERIVEYRRAHGPFTKPEELQKVVGIGAGVLKRNRDRIVVK